MHSSKQLIIFILITAVLFSAVGFYAAGFTVKRQTADNNTTIVDSQDTFQAGWNAAREKLKESGFMILGETKGLNGSVKKISGNKIILSTNLINPLDDETLKTRTAVVDSNTIIEIQKEKTQEEITVEEAEQSTKIDALKEQKKTAVSEEEKMDLEMQIMDLQMPIDFFKQEKAGIKDIKAGDNISVTAEEDIAEKKEFTAAWITIDKIITIPGEPIL